MSARQGTDNPVVRKFVHLSGDESAVYLDDIENEQPQVNNNAPEEQEPTPPAAIITPNVSPRR